MNASDPFKEYTQAVCEQIRWKKAHASVAKELEDHLLDQKEAYIACGDSEETAAQKALLQMGDPVAVGMSLDNTHKPAPQKGMLALVIALLCIGTFLQFQFIPLLAQTHLQEMYASRLYVILPLAVVTLLLFYHLDFSFFGTYPYLLPVLLMVSIFAKELFGVQINGQRWFLLGSLSFSPMQLSLLFPLGLSCILYRFRRYSMQGYFGACCLTLFTALLLGSFFSLAALFVFAFAAGIVLFTASIRNWFGRKTKPVFFGFTATGILFLVCLLFFAPFRYRWNRLTYVLHPEADPNGYGYFTLLLRDLLTDAKLFGAADTLAENAMFPNMIKDTFCSEYFLTFITYRFGWIVSIGLVLLLSGFLVWSFCKCLKQKSVLGQMVSLSILSVFTAECFFYLLTNLGYPFIASASLPFLSYGMNSMLIHMALTGILLSVFRTGEVQTDFVHVSPVKEKHLIQWIDGTLMIRFR